MQPALHRLELAPIVVALALGVVDALVILADGITPDSVATIAFALGYQLALGACVSGLALASNCTTSRFVRASCLVVVALALAWLTLRLDLTPLATRLLPTKPWLVLAPTLALASIALVAVGFASRSLPSRWLPWSALVPATLVQATNHRVLAQDYAGVHFWLTLFAFALAVGGLSGRLGFARESAALRGFLSCAGLAGVACLFIAPTTPTLVGLRRHEGASLTPFVAELRVRFHQHPRHAAHARRRPDRRPTTPGLGLDRPIVILLTVDCLRADILETDRSRLPSLARLASESVRFTGAHTAAPATMVSITSLMTGRFYSEQYWTPMELGGSPLPHEDRTPGFATFLGRAGVDTLAIESSDWMNPRYGVVRGFDRVTSLPRAPGQTHTLARGIVDALLLDLRANGGPRLLYAHFLEAHAPYTLAGPRRSERAGYVAELGLVDEALGALLEGLTQLGLDDRTVVIVAADHGEAFGEHGGGFHGTTLYEEVLRVPLFVRLPSRASRDEPAPVSTLDLAPTLVDVFGLPIDGGFAGETLLPALLGRSLPRDRVLAADSGRLVRAILFPDGLKLIYDVRTHASELYDLRHDPRERVNLFATTGALGTEVDQLTRYFEALPVPRRGYSPPYRVP